MFIQLRIENGASALTPARLKTIAGAGGEEFSVTAGKDFVQRVEKVTDPEEAYYEVEDGVEIPAPIYYRLVEN